MDAIQQQRFQANLRLINQVYPQYASMIASAPDRHEYVVEPQGENTCLCRIPAEGEMMEAAWIHGPDSPWAEAESAIQRSDWRETRLMLILRPGLGYYPFSLYPNLRKGRHAQRMLLVEDRIDLFRLSLYWFDWTDVLRSDRTILLLTEDPVGSSLQFFITNPISLLPPITVFCGSVYGKEEQRMMENLEREMMQLVYTVSQATRVYLNDLGEHYVQRARSGAMRRRVLLIEPEHDYLANPIMEAFREEGCEVNQFKGNVRLLRFLNPYAWLVYTREHFPDILLWMNRNTLSPEGEECLKQFPIQKVLWFLDSPKRVETSAEELVATDEYFSFDAAYLPYLKELGGKAGHCLPTAAGIRPAPGCEPGENRVPRNGPEVGFLGALAVSRFQEVRRFWLGRDAEFVRLLDEIVEAYLADGSRSLEERYEASPARERLPYRGFVVLYLEERATYLHRLRMLKSIKEFGLVTYGAVEWGQSEWADDLVSCYAGYAPQYENQLPRVYYQTRININLFHVQCVNSTNPRIYDVLAAGGFLLTEYRPALEEEFTPGRHLACFRTIEELRERIQYYREHVEEREEIAREGQRFVLEHATYRARVKTMLRTLWSAEHS